MAVPTLSKTDFIRGLQCPKMLWLDAHKPGEKKISEETQDRLDLGTTFGDDARGMFGPFVDVTEYIPNTKYLDKRKMVLNTRNEMRNGTENICEASFEWNGCFCAIDILHRVDKDVYELYEVKNSPEMKEHFVYDAGYQAWVADKCGVQLDGVFVVYHYDDEYDPFEPVDVTEEAIEFAHVVDESIDRLKAAKAATTEPEAVCGEQCTQPYECWYREYCGDLAKTEE